MTTKTTFAIPALALALTACLSSNEPKPPHDFGFVLLETQETSAGYQTEISGVFYRATTEVELPSTEQERDTCVRRPGFVGNPIGILPATISAGTPVELTLSGHEIDLVMNVSELSITYAPVIEAWETVPGDAATLTVPGDPDGFPTFDLTAKTAEAFTAGPVPTYASPTPITLEWTPAEEAGSRMSVTLQYFLNQQAEHVYCELVDDGAHTLPADWVDGYRAAASKSAFFSRDRITTATVGSATMLLSSTFSVNAATPDLSTEELLGPVRGAAIAR